MGRYILKRLILMLPVLVGVTIIVFTLLYFTPGDPAKMILGSNATSTEIEMKRAELGLNDGYFVRLIRYISGVAVGDFGKSYLSDRPVIKEIFDRFPSTFLLAVIAMCISSTVGVSMGVIAAVNQNTWKDNMAMAFALVGVSMPNFWLGLMLSIIFALKLGWLPASGFYGPSYWILPALTVSVQGMATIARQTRSSMLEVIRQDYIRTARAKGQKELIVVIIHALKNALIPVLTSIGMMFGALLCGAMVTEVIFSIPGLGNFMVSSIKNRDFPAVQGCVLFVAITVGFMNLIVDILYAYVDPRIKSQYKRAQGRA